jgi:cytoskeletal protein RodZ
MNIADFFIITLSLATFNLLKIKSNPKTMADKDPKDDELNQEGQEDINNDDDSFGLPDLDYQPLEDSVEEEQEAAEIEEDVVEEVEDANTDELETEEEEIEEPVRKYAAYQEESNNTPMILVGVLAIILIGAGIWYFGFYRPAAQEQAQIEQAAIDLAEQNRQRELAAQRAAEVAATEEEVVAEETIAEDETPTTRGKITTISEPTQRYYVVVGSFIDVDLATDLGKDLAAKGVNTSLISPSSKHRLFRLALANYGSYNEAASAAADLKGNYGENLWVLKY